jgi:DNA modification methylase
VSVRILIGDCRDTLRDLPDGCVQTVVTSPPYFGLRDYGTGEWEGGDPACDHVQTRSLKRDTNGGMLPAGQGTRGTQSSTASSTIQFREECGKCGARRVDRQIGLEPSPDEFVQALVGVFREVRRVLRDDGTVWINLGDSYASTPSGSFDKGQRGGGPLQGGGFRANKPFDTSKIPGVKAKDLIGTPWMVAFALRADGWYLRSDIIWSKPNPMPESVTDRPTKAHEYVFLLSKGPRYFYDADAIREPHEGYMAEWRAKNGREEIGPKWREMEEDGTHGVGGFSGGMNPNGRNKRSVWTVATAPYPGAHFATFPPKLIEPCILAGSSPKACGVCGAPWQRVVERTPMANPDGSCGCGVTHGNVRFKAGGEGHLRNDYGDGRDRLYCKATSTVGWEPSCGHQDDTGQSVVLDPFAGSGTTGAVALEHGRAFIGCELNPAYGELIRDRLLSAPLALEGFGAA